MTHTSLSDRLDELFLLVEEGDLSRLSRRLLDLGVDFSLPLRFRQEAIAIRAAFNAETDPEKQQALLARSLRLLEQVEGMAEAEPQESAGLSKPPPPSEQEAQAFYNRPGRARASRGEVVCEGKGIGKTFRSNRYTFRLPRLDLTLRLGEITGVVGENGNGKTTLLRIVAGDLEADQGTLTYPAFHARPKDWYAIKQHIAFIPQQLQPWQGFLKENLHFAASIHGITGKENEEQVEFILHRLGLSRYEDALWSEVSSGYRLRFTLARALVWRPSLLIIDEPLANLDINTQQMFLQDLRYLAGSTQNPMAILLTSQHLHEVESVADHILFIQNGELLYNGPMKDFGQDRVENLFEVATESSKAELLTALQPLPGVTVEDTGKVKLIHTPTGVSANEVLHSLLSHGITLQYFRDISTSTLKFFRDSTRKSS